MQEHLFIHITQRFQVQYQRYQEIFEETDAPDCCKMTYLTLAMEVERRKATFKREPKGSAFIELNTALARIAKLRNLTTEEYIRERFIPEFLE